MKSKKTILLFVLILLAGGGGYYYYLQQKPSVVEYATQKVVKGDIESVVLANGMLQAAKLVNVGAQVSGQILKLDVDLGDKIKQGDLIAQIDSLTQQNNLKEAQASLDSLNAQYRAKEAEIKQAKYEYNRQKGMLAAHASSRADFESAEATLAVYEADLDQLTAQIKQATISVDTAKVDLGYTTISAPIDGTVVYTAVEAGQTVNANQTTPTIIELAQLDTMTIKAEISEADVINVHPGQKAYFSILGKPNQKFEGVLKAIEPGPTIMDGDDSNLAITDSDAIYYNALFDVKNPNNILRIGMTAEVSVLLDQAKDTLLIPAQVLKPAREKGSYQVPVLENNQLVYKKVKIGLNNKVQAEVLSGLKEGDEVIIGIPSGGADNLRPPRMRF